MGLFDSNKQKYVTRGINEQVPVELQLIMFEAIEEWRRQGKEIDYLQVFICNTEKDVNGSIVQIITHNQEVPEIAEVIRVPAVNGGFTGKIFVIDESPTSAYFVMLLCDEY